MEIKQRLFDIYQFGLIALIVSGAIVGLYFFGRKMLKKQEVAKWYFWVAYLFAVPIIAAPVVLFGSLFMDRVRHDDLVPIAWLMINSYALWFVLGFSGSMKLYDKVPRHFAILPSVLSWLFAAAAVLGGIYLVNY